MKKPQDLAQQLKDEVHALEDLAQKQLVHKTEGKLHIDHALTALNFFNRDFSELESNLSSLHDLRDIIARRGDDQLEGTLEYFLELLEDLYTAAESLGIKTINQC